MSMKEEYTAIDMSTAAADGFRDGQRAANDHSAQSLGMVGALVTALDGLLSITQDSTGVAGYHLNGNVAEWDEFPEVDTARDVLSLYRERADKPCFFGIDLAQGALDAGPWRDAIIDQGWTPPEQQQASDKVPCKTHPDAPHGFCRNSSHTAGRYVCECEHWEEPQASAAQSAGVPDVSAMARVLSDRSADACNIDRADNWAMYGQEYIEDVQAMLAAPAQPAVQREWPDDEIVAAWKWCEENGGTPAEFLSHSLLVKRSRVLGRPLTWREAIELTAITTNMPDERRDKLLAMDDEPDAAAQDQGEVQRLREALEGMLEYFPEGASDGECFAVDAARAALAASTGQEVE